MTNLEWKNVVTMDHMTHINNLSGILTHGLRAHNNPFKKVDISNHLVNHRRSACEPIYGRPIHDYVPFYFNARNAMLYRNQKQFGDAVILLGFNKQLVEKDGMVLTNGNAACDNTLFSDRATYAHTFDWDRIFSASWCKNGVRDEGLKQQMMAEVLILNCVDISELRVIFCNSQAVADFISANFSLGNVCVRVDPKQFF